MREDNIVDGSGQFRPVLGNLTNRPLKRGLSMLLGDSGLKSGDDCEKNAGDGSRFPKHPRLDTAKSVKDNSKRMCGKLCCTLALSRSNMEPEFDCSSTSSEADTALSNVPKECVQRDLLNDESHPVQDDKQRITQGDTLRDPCLLSSVVPTCSGSNEKNCSSNTENEGKLDHVLTDNEKDIGMGKLASSNHGYTEWSRLPKSEVSKSLGLERCSGLKTNNCANQDACDDLLKTCSCSFCLKASYILSDLHYQDIKGRISALKKSQKEASNVAQKISKEKDTNQDQENSSKSKLEYDLSDQWTSLFCHMEDRFAKEANHLQTSFVALKDLREECKMKLETFNGTPSEKH